MNETTSLRSNKPIWMQRHISAVAVLSAISVAVPSLGDMDAATIASGIFVASIAALCASAGFWLGFGDSRLRFFVIPLGLCIVAFFTSAAFRYSQLLEMGIFCFITTSAVGMPITIVRIVRRGRLLLESQSHDGTSSREVFRFSIWEVLVFMTVASVLLAIGKAVVDSAVNLSPNAYFRFAVPGATLGICSIVIVWATLGKQPFERNIVSGIVAVGLGVLNDYFLGGGGGATWRIWFFLTMVVWLEMTILMWLVRSEGYRFVVASDSQQAGG